MQASASTEQQSTKGRTRVNRRWRQQIGWKMIDLERVIGENHKARAIVDLVSRFDLREFHTPIKSTEHGPGRDAEDPALLISVWIYGYSEGTGSARELAREMEYEPGLLWILGGREPLGHNKLSEFRAMHGEALKNLFTQLLTLLDSGGWMDLKRVMQDGTKIQAQAGQDSFRGESSIASKLEKARAAVEQLGAEESAEASRGRSARERARREQLERMEEAWKELQAQKEATKAEPDRRVRVSVTEPEARRMKHGNDGGIAPSYNLQLSTDAKEGIIVDMELTQAATDAHQLLPAIKRIEVELERKPEQVVADGGYTTRAAIVGTAALGVDYIGSLGDEEGRQRAALKRSGIDPAYGPGAFVQIETGSAHGKLECPAGKVLAYQRKSKKRGMIYWQYQARGSDCVGCAHQSKCCPQKPERGRLVSVIQELPEVEAFRSKMKTEPAQQAYKRRGQIAEFPNACIKEKYRLRKFHLWGLARARIEALWVCLTYNTMQFIRLSKAAVALQAA